MTDYSEVDFGELANASDQEVVTHSFVQDVRLRSGRTLALITLDNEMDYRRPNTLGPRTLLELGATLDALRQRAQSGEIAAVGITGKQYIFAAGADLSRVGDIASHAAAVKLAQLGHFTLGKLRTLGVPSFAFINGLALGGGLEVALNANYRTVDSSVTALGLPEVFLGLIPGWGGAFLLPQLIGIKNALTVIIENPLKNNRLLAGPHAHKLGISDAIFGPARFLEQSLNWADSVLSGYEPDRVFSPGWTERTFIWPTAVKIARKAVSARLGTVAHAPFAALDLLEFARKNNEARSFEREDDAIANLIVGDQFRASMYAFDLVQKRAKKPAGAPDPSLARPVNKVGIIGAGLMARQFALLFARKLRVPVVLTDIDQSRLDEAITYIRGEVQKSFIQGRITADENNQIQGLVTSTTQYSDFSAADWVIEAVFEELAIKQDVFARIEPHIAPHAILATNTSSLSVREIGAKLRNPERLVGFHFFNPVAVMPLIEVVRTAQVTDDAVATAMAVAKKLGKTAVITADSTGFVVNRVLARLLGEAMHAVDSGTEFGTVDQAISNFGLPMTPFELLDLVGLTVGAHVLDTHHAAYPDRFFDSANLHKLADLGHITVKDSRGNLVGYHPAATKLVQESLAQHGSRASALTQADIQRRIEDGLADEIHRMVNEQVVTAVEDIDLCLILGAGWPFQMGGATPFLDRVGASERVFGTTFHHPPIKGIE